MSDGTLLIQDSRTSKQYTISVTSDTITAVDFQKITSPTGKLALYDPGLQNTIIKKTQITGRYVVGSIACILNNAKCHFPSDPATGITLFRGLSAKEIWNRHADFEDHFHLLVFGKYPSPDESEALRRRLAVQMKIVPETVIKVVQAFPWVLSFLQIFGIKADIPGSKTYIPSPSHDHRRSGRLHIRRSVFSASSLWWQYLSRQSRPL